MKLSAPPPPPPDPNDPPPHAAGQPPESPETPSAEAPPPSTTPPKALTWPAWFVGADFLLAVLVLVLAFLVSSFAARNSDIWLHLAAGKRLLAGEYTPGTDPFSYSAADRTWVNHSILFDVAAYLLYGGAGMLLVIVKALLVVGAFVLVLSLRRPGHSLWPWAGVAIIAVIAVTPYVHLRPIVGSMFLFGLTLFLLFRGNYRPGSWTFPIAIGVTFWLWANVDEWFFLGPLAVALVLVGELIQRSILRTQSAEEPASPTLGSPPDVPALAKALGIGILACMLNPHHIHIWQLPLELTGARELAIDPRLQQILLSPLDRDYYASTPMGRATGHTLNGLAYAILFVAGGAALGLAGSRLRLSHLLLWVGIALLSLQTIYLIPFVALLAVPLVASQLNALSAGLTLRTWGDPRTRLVLLGSGFGRVVVILFVLVSCVRAWPGWMHPTPGNEAFARRVAWEVEVDRGMVRGVEQLQAWRTGEDPPLGEEARGIILSLEFANYCAWFAPQEKVYANAHYRHHAQELRTYTDLRKAMSLVGPFSPAAGDPILKDEANRLLRDLGVEYVVVHATPGDSPTFRLRAQLLSQVQWFFSPQWSPWYLDGRSTISGWRPEPGAGEPSFDALRLDPLVLAFGPDAKQLRAGTVAPVRKRGGWEDAFFLTPQPTPPEANETMAWVGYKQAKASFAAQFRHPVWRSIQVMGNELAGGWPGMGSQLAWAYGLVPEIPPDNLAYATPLLALRAAHRAIAADPDHPDGYWALFIALGDPELPLEETVRYTGQVTALQRCLQRFPAPENLQSAGGLTSPYEVARRLGHLYAGRRGSAGSALDGIPVNTPTFQFLKVPRGSRFLPVATVVISDMTGRAQAAWVGAVPPQLLSPRTPTPGVVLPLDEARKTLELAKSYLLATPFQDEREMSGRLNELDQALKQVRDQLGVRHNRYEQRKLMPGGQLKLPAQVEAALEFNLIGEALDLLADTPTVEKEFGATAPHALLSRTGLQLVVGRLEEAAEFLDAIATSENWQAILAAPGNQDLRQVAQMLQYHADIMSGNFAEAGKILEGVEGEFWKNDPTKQERDRFDPKPYVESKQSFQDWVRYAPLSALLAPTPHDVVVRVFAPPIALGGYAGKRGFVELQTELAQLRQAEAEFHLRRGILSLLEGDIRWARKRFEQTRPSSEQKDEDAKWGLESRRVPVAELYLRLLDEAASRAGKK